MEVIRVELAMCRSAVRRRTRCNIPVDPAITPQGYGRQEELLTNLVDAAAISNHNLVALEFA
jgi:hypothetical protein